MTEHWVGDEDGSLDDGRMMPGRRDIYTTNNLYGVLYCDVLTFTCICLARRTNTIVGVPKDNS